MGDEADASDSGIGSMIQRFRLSKPLSRDERERQRKRGQLREMWWVDRPAGNSGAGSLNSSKIPGTPLEGEAWSDSGPGLLRGRKRRAEVPAGGGLSWLGAERGPGDGDEAWPLPPSPHSRRGSSAHPSGTAGAAGGAAAGAGSGGHATIDDFIAEDINRMLRSSGAAGRGAGAVARATLLASPHEAALAAALSPSSPQLSQQARRPPRRKLVPRPGLPLPDGDDTDGLFSESGGSAGDHSDQDRELRHSLGLDAAAYAGPLALRGGPEPKPKALAEAERKQKEDEGRQAAAASVGSTASVAADLDLVIRRLRDGIGSGLGQLPPPGMDAAGYSSGPSPPSAIADVVSQLETSLAGFHAGVRARRDAEAAEQRRRDSWRGEERRRIHREVCDQVLDALGDAFGSAVALDGATDTEDDRDSSVSSDGLVGGGFDRSHRSPMSKHFDLCGSEMAREGILRVRGSTTAASFGGEASSYGQRLPAAGPVHIGGLGMPAPPSPFALLDQHRRSNSMLLDPQLVLARQMAEVAEAVARRIRDIQAIEAGIELGSSQATALANDDGVAAVAVASGGSAAKSLSLLAAAEVTSETAAAATAAAVSPERLAVVAALGSAAASAPAAAAPGSAAAAAAAVVAPKAPKGSGGVEERKGEKSLPLSPHRLSEAPLSPGATAADVLGRSAPEMGRQQRLGAWAPLLVESALRSRAAASRRRRAAREKEQGANGVYGQASLQQTSRSIAADLEVAMLCMQQRLGHPAVAAPDKAVVVDKTPQEAAVAAKAAAAASEEAALLERLEYIGEDSDNDDGSFSGDNVGNGGGSGGGAARVKSHGVALPGGAGYAPEHRPPWPAAGGSGWEQQQQQQQLYWPHPRPWWFEPAAATGAADTYSAAYQQYPQHVAAPPQPYGWPLVDAGSYLPPPMQQWSNPGTLLPVMEVPPSAPPLPPPVEPPAATASERWVQVQLDASGAAGAAQDALSRARAFQAEERRRQAAKRPVPQPSSPQRVFEELYGNSDAEGRQRGRSSAREAEAKTAAGSAAGYALPQGRMDGAAMAAARLRLQVQREAAEARHAAAARAWAPAAGGSYQSGRATAVAPPMAPHSFSEEPRQRLAELKELRRATQSLLEQPVAVI